MKGAAVITAALAGTASVPQFTVMVVVDAGSAAAMVGVAKAASRASVIKGFIFILYVRIGLGAGRPVVIVIVKLRRLDKLGFRQ